MLSASSIVCALTLWMGSLFEMRQLRMTKGTHLSRNRIEGSMHTTASALICSFSNSSRVRTSSKSTLKFGLYFHS